MRLSYCGRSASLRTSESERRRDAPGAWFLSTARPMQTSDGAASVPSARRPRGEGFPTAQNESFVHRPPKCVSRTSPTTGQACQKQVAVGASLAWTSARGVIDVADAAAALLGHVDVVLAEGGRTHNGDV